MSRDRIPPDRCPVAANTVARAQVEADLAAMQLMLDIGLDLLRGIQARALSRQAPDDDNDEAGDAADPSVGDDALAYYRITRSLRLTSTIRSSLVEQLRRVETIEQHRDREAARAAEDHLAELTDQRIDRVQAVVGRIAEIEHDRDPAAVDRIARETAEQLEDEDRFGDIASRPSSEIIELICAGFGLTPDWPSLAQEAWAREEIASGRIGAPLAAWLASVRQTSGPPRRPSRPIPAGPPPQRGPPIRTHAETSSS